eukprot:jgi/Antlo1/1330/2165
MLQRYVAVFLPSWLLPSERLLTGFKPRMDISEAKLILNIRKINRNNIDKAYKNMMLMNHPDRNGSEYIATKINDARNLLLKQTRY